MTASRAKPAKDAIRTGRPTDDDADAKRDAMRAIVLHPVLRDEKLRAGRHGADVRPAERIEVPAEARLEEAVGLSKAIQLDVVQSGLVNVSRPRPATLIGSGKVEELKGIIEAEGAGLIIIDHALTAVQQRNLERAWNAKVLDRTGLILEIFGERARTKEGRLQVELAHLLYQRSRLVRSWTHLERQRGGFGFLGGPGETQIEADRRIIGERIDSIKRDLAAVRRTRGLHRTSRRRTPFPTVALAGYTNAGKSSLFNALTRAEVVAEDKLFATLDPTMRRLEVPSATAIISDTVGFISELPTTLVAAFRATLEEVSEADLILHVRDIAAPFSHQQKQDVEGVLAELGVDLVAYGDRLIEVWNKIDLLNEAERQKLVVQAARLDPRPVLVSARTGEGLDDLRQCIADIIARDHITRVFSLGGEDGALLHWLYEYGEVLAREDFDDGSSCVEARLTAADLKRFEAMRARKQPEKQQDGAG